ncbi:MAG TPA: 16S rRNA (adenine(1518)-N(6)/adenine(1519)-N(6))-dimethyltransferase RsmA [Clostridiales bacterium]|nr:16S rRNA (adenine(1518)-N(6)/adenine(1519)-N(6))-dimethyltransferase RsmA [Clostridiales bacterium]
MAELGSPKKTIEIIKKFDFIIQKKFGQNFLIDSNVLEKIVKEADINDNDLVIEIGPGIGTLTQYLCEAANEVIAIEIDKKLIPILNETLSDYNNVTILNQDILKTDLEQLINNKKISKTVKVVANLPYYITTPIVMDLLESRLEVDSITVMVQKEVAERMKANPGTKEYGALSLAVQYYCEPEIVANVPASCFMPRPKVGSSVIKLSRYKTLQFNVEDEKLLFQIIRASFNQRRKTLVNGLYNSSIKNLSKIQIAEVLIELGYLTNVRGEDLNLEAFIALSNKINRI